MSADRSGSWHRPTTVHPSELHGPVPAGYIFGTPIPAATTQSPGELLSRFYHDRRNEPDWTDPNGVLSKQMEVLLHHPHNAAATVGASGLVGKWPRPNGLAAEPVPVPSTILGAPQLVVEFGNRDIECPSRGVSLVDLYVQNADTLEGAEDVVCDRFGKGDLRLIIAWPGYSPLQLRINPIAGNGRPLTRFGLAQEITMAYAHLFFRVEGERLLPRRVGFYNIALHQGRNARADSLGVQLSQLYLVRFRGTIGGNWVADVEIV